MSKRSLFWGNASGKLGEAVFYRAGGEQRTRTWVPKIKNPKSRAQAVQRTKLNNLTALYKGMQTAIQNFTRIEKSGRSAFNQFVANNSNINQWVADKGMIEKKQGVGRDFVITKGDIDITTLLSYSTTNPVLGGPLSAPVVNGTGKSLAYCFSLGIGGSVTYDNTRTANGDEAYTGSGAYGTGLVSGKEFYQYLTGNGNPYNLPAEFTVSIVLGEVIDDAFDFQTYSVKCSADSTDKLKYVQFFNEDPTYTSGTKNSILNMCVPIDGEVQRPTGQPTQATGITGASFLAICPTEILDSGKKAAAFIIAYKDDAGLHTSGSQLCVMKSSDLETTLGSDIVEDYLPTGTFGTKIVSQYEIASNSLV